MSKRLAFGAGLVAGGVVVGILAWRKGEQLKRRGGQMAATLEAGGSDLEAYLMSQGEDIATEMERIAREEIERTAQQTADHHMGAVYGLSPDRIARISRLATVIESATAPLRSLF